MSMAERDILARLRLSGEQFSQELDAQFSKVPVAAERAGSEAGDRFSSGFGTKLAGLTIAAGSAAALVGQAIGKSLDLAKELGETSRGLRVNVESLQLWRAAAVDVGGSAEELDASLGTLNDKIRAAHDGNRDAQQSFVDLSVGFDSVNGRARETDMVFRDVTERLSKIEDPSKRAELASRLLGEEFDRLLPLAQGGARGLDELTESAREYGVVLSADAIRDLDETNNKIDRMQQILSIKIATVVAENADSIGYLTDQVLGLASAAVRGTADFLKFRSAVQEKSQRYADIYARKDLTEAQKNAAKAQVDRELGFEDKPVAGFLGTLGFRESKYIGKPKSAPDYFGVGSMMDLAREAREAAINAPVAPHVDPKKPRGKSEAQKAAEKAEREREAAIKRAWEQEKKLSSTVDETIQKQQDSVRVEEVRASMGERAAAQEEARLTFEREHPEEAAKTVAQLAVMLGMTKDIVTANKMLTTEQKAQLQADIDKLQVAKQGAIREAGAKVDKKAAEEATKAAKDAAEERARIDKQATEKWKREQEAAIRDIAYLYEDLFTGGVDRVWKDFKSIGLRVISEVAAKWTLATISGQSINVGQTFNASLMSSPLGSLFGGLTGSGAANDNQPSATFQNAFKDLSDLGISNIMPGDQPIPGTGTGTGALGKSGSLLDQAGFALAASSLVGLTGLGGGGTGSQLGGMVGSIGGQALGSSLAALGSFGGPIGAIGGAILGTLAGSLLDGVLNPNRTANAHLTSISDVTYGGKDKKNYGAASGLGGSVVDGLQQIAAALGAELGSFNTTIGTRGDEYRVNTNGTSLKLKNGAVGYGQDAEAAVAAAIQDAINDGVLVGVSQAAQNILKSGQDLEEAITKAAAIESIPKLLKQRLDPLGAALEELDGKYKELAETLKEGGASAEQIAQARELWQLEREDTIKQIGDASATLKNFLSSLSVGSNSPLSLRQQEQSAREALSPYTAQIEAAKAAQAELDRLKAGGASAADIKKAEEAARAAAGKIDQEGFQEAAQALLGIERSINGSSTGFFDTFNQIKQLTGDAANLIDAVTTESTDAATDPFSSLIAASTSDTANLLTDTNSLLKQTIAQNDNLISSFADFGSYLKAMKQKGWY
ncbi:MAG TPA: hypothetical protein VMQ93_16200 [Novosphingobium sp.]|nr:hypothetical protein [Novosphingobium sp.]